MVRGVAVVGLTVCVSFTAVAQFRDFPREQREDAISRGRIRAEQQRSAEDARKLLELEWAEEIQLRGPVMLGYARAVMSRAFVDLTFAALPDLSGDRRASIVAARKSVVWSNPDKYCGRRFCAGNVA
jgi:hypothetical protein